MDEARHRAIAWGYIERKDRSIYPSHSKCTRKASTGALYPTRNCANGADNTTLTTHFWQSTGHLSL